jgi:hypothetical protein
MTEHEGASSAFSRRQVLQRSGVAVGLIWSTPLVKSVRQIQNAGSPPPSSTTTTAPRPIRLTFTGLFTVRNQTIDLSDPACAFARWRIDATADLAGQPSDITVNPAQFQLDFCADIGAFSDGSMSFDFPGGDLTGDLESGFYSPGGTVGQFFPQELSLTFDVTGGTGALTGAGGSVHMEATWPRFADLTNGTVNGTIDTRVREAPT